MPRRPRVLPFALALLVLSPVCAEYLFGYDDSTGRPAVLLANLFIFVPLYGAPALLIRELARRRGLDWPGVLLLCAAFGVVQAAVIDQSIFSQDYRGIAYWDDITRPTAIPAFGLSAYTALTFVGGHVVLSFGGPIAVVEALAGRSRAVRPWLRAPGLVVAVIVYLAAAAAVIADQARTEADHATVAQLAVAIVVAAVLVVLAARSARTTPTRTATPPEGRAALRAFAVAFGAGIVYIVLPPTWVGTLALIVLATAVAAYAIRHRRAGRWSSVHGVALAGGALAAAAVTSFFADPLGDLTTPAAKYANNAALLALVLVLTFAAARRAAATLTPR